jgi:hypothetical protein
MAHTFEIRFARSAGFAALFEAPANRFRWKGDGRLSIDAGGISFAVKRRLTSLFARNQTRHIAAGNLKDLYREGDALRLEFATSDSPHEVVPFWAYDRDAAAEIVRLIPTTHTVELEHTTASPKRAEFKVDRRVLAAFLVIFILGLGAAYFLTRTEQVAVPLTLAPIDVAQIPAPAAALEARPTRLVPGSVSFASAAEELSSFETQADGLLADYRRVLRDYENDVINREQFALELEGNLIPRWWSVTDATLRNPWMADQELVEFRGALLSTARHWRNFLDGYARGVHTRDSAVVQDAFEQLGKAEQSARLAASFVR